MKSLKFSERAYVPEMNKTNFIVTENYIVKDSYFVPKASGEPTRNNITDYFILNHDPSLWESNSTKLVEGTLASTTSEIETLYIAYKVDEKNINFTKVALTRK